MALMSDPILVADATPWSFAFSNYRSSVSVQVRFFTDLAGLVEVGSRGTGSRDLTAWNVSSAYSGKSTKPTATLRNFTSDLTNGTITGVPDGRWTELLLDGGLGQVTIAAVANTPVGGSVTYRIIVDAEGHSSAA